MSTGERDGILRLIRLSEASMWAGRSITRITKLKIALQWWQNILLSGYSELTGDHNMPIWTPTNYATTAEMLGTLARHSVRKLFTDRVPPYTEAQILAKLDRIKVLTADSCKNVTSWGARFMSNPTLLMHEADLLIATQTVEAGVSVNGHFKIVFAFYQSMVGGINSVLQSFSRVRDRADLHMHSFMYLENRHCNVPFNIHEMLEIATAKQPSTHDRSKLALAHNLHECAKWKNSTMRETTIFLENLKLLHGQDEGAYHDELPFQNGSAMAIANRFPAPNPSGFVIQIPTTRDLMDLVTTLSR